MQGVVVPKPQLNLRLDPRTAELIKRLQRHMNLTAAGLIRLALIRMARAEGVEVPDGDD